MQDTLARKLRVLRAERGLTLREAERVSGVDKDTLSKIERGVRRPHDVTLSKIAKGYGVDVEELLVEEVPEDPGAGAPQLSLGQFIEHGIEPTRAEIATVNALLAVYTEIAQTGAEKATLVVPEGPVNLERVNLLVDYATMAGILSPYDIAVLRDGVRSKLISSSGRSG
jgi:transcriptional regulator with XRE-family HTH domain